MDEQKPRSTFSRREFLPTVALLGGSLLAAEQKKSTAAADAERQSAVLSEEAAAVLNEVSARNTQPNRPTGKDEADNIAIHQRDCSAIIQACRKQKLHKLEFRGNLTWAHESLLKMTSLDLPVKAGPRELEPWIAAVTLWVDGLKEAGFAGVDINMGLFPWYNEDKASIAKVEKAIERIQRAGLRMAFNPELNPWASGKLADFEAYTQASVKVWSMLARRFQPAVLMVTHEIFTMRWRLGFEVPMEKWVDYLRRTAAAVKEASPRTLVGVGFVPGTFAQDLRYAEKLAPMPEMDLISVDIYDLRGFDRTNTVVKWAKAAGKRVFIEETWRAVYWPKEVEVKFKGGEGVWDGVGVGAEKFQPIDALWMEMVSVYAAAWGMETVVPFWTQVMFKYLQTDDWQKSFVYSAEYNAAVREALLKGERTKTFHAWKKLIQELGRTRAELA